MTLSPLASRTIAWGILTNLCWIIVAFGIAPLLSQVGSDRETIASSRELLARYHRLEADLPAVTAQVTELREIAENNHYFFVSASSAVAAAEMQNAMRGLVASSGAVLRSSKSLPAGMEQGFDRVGIDLEVLASTPQLVGLLRAIAATEPVVLVDRLFAQVPETGVTSAAADGQPAIAVTLRLVSYARRPQVGSKS
jgi:general secretion pathway protein M